MQPNCESQLEVGIYAPFGRDEQTLVAAIRDNRFSRLPDSVAVSVAPSSQSWHRSILVCSQEGFSKKFKEDLVGFTDTQPSWAQIPLVLVLDHDVSAQELHDELRDILDKILLTVLHRPLRPFELTTTIENAIAARERQFEIKRYIDYQEELQNELNHRIKNTLASVFALYQISLRHSSDLPDFDKRFGARLGALSSVQDLLRSSDNRHRSLEDIANAVLAPYNKGEVARTILSGDRQLVSQQPAQTLALIFNELATNASKYGSLSTEAGRVHIEYRKPDGQPATLTWRETGGPGVQPPTRKSYGTRFIEASAAGLGGDVRFDYQEPGLTCIITLDAELLHRTTDGGTNRL
ncbi:MAG: sensor histidine kinase [Alphaproteobacteria bacterium]|nr:sensor histidine kinase [Alphaproteobacteria bacterium]